MFNKNLASTNIKFNPPLKHTFIRLYPPCHETFGTLLMELKCDYTYSMKQILIAVIMIAMCIYYINNFGINVYINVVFAFIILTIIAVFITPVIKKPGLLFYEYGMVIYKENWITNKKSVLYKDIAKVERAATTNEGMQLVVTLKDGKSFTFVSSKYLQGKDKLLFFKQYLNLNPFSETVEPPLDDLAESTQSSTVLRKPFAKYAAKFNYTIKHEKFGPLLLRLQTIYVSIAFLIIGSLLLALFLYLTISITGGPSVMLDVLYETARNEGPGIFLVVFILPFAMIYAGLRPKRIFFYERGFVNRTFFKKTEHYYKDIENVSIVKSKQQGFVTTYYDYIISFKSGPDIVLSSAYTGIEKGMKMLRSYLINSKFINSSDWDK